MNLLLLALLTIMAAVAVRFLRGAFARRRATQLVDASFDFEAFGLPLDAEEEGWLERWLARAGFRDPAAPMLFIAATAGLAAIGLALIFALNRSGVLRSIHESLLTITGGLGEAFAVVAEWAPWIIMAILVSVPLLVVRAARRERVEAVEQDLAPALELLATLAEAGLGFDAAMSRIQETETGQRPLSREFQVYQRDILGGISRLESLRRLARRIDVTSVSIFVSALIQAEQVGTSLSETLRIQADDLRDRRKLNALVRAQALPVKLAFPLMACFLPGIYFATLGPVLSQLVDVVDAVMRR
jgi:pilus assembly protein TadC